MRKTTEVSAKTVMTIITAMTSGVRLSFKTGQSCLARLWVAVQSDEYTENKVGYTKSRLLNNEN